MGKKGSARVRVKLNAAGRKALKSSRRVPVVAVVTTGKKSSDRAIVRRRP